jgi:NAD(P)-dependent dehydrogenase (short-subunit alcohol dehydrogenase family)
MSMVTQPLVGKKVLLTGALGSLGRAQAKSLAVAGAGLFLIDRPDAAHGHDFAASLAQQTGATVSYIGQDLIDLEAALRRVEALVSEHGPIDILINNAALIVNKPFDDFSMSEFEEQMRVNAAAAFAMVKAVAPGMKTKKYGKIVNFCSLTMNGRWDGFVPYTATKGAVWGLTKTLARELGKSGIRVNAVSPGAVVSEAETRVFGDKAQEYHDWIIENQSLKQRMEPEHVAELVLFLVSPASDMITGQIINIDGGW